MITIDKLKKNFGEKVAVDIEHYEINQGDMLGLVGNNGAGKTTLFRLMLDLLKADDGKVIINDIDVSQSEDWKSITGAFIDDGFLIDYLTPEEYFYFIGKMYGLKKEEVDERLIPFERFMSGEVIGHKKLIQNQQYRQNHHPPARPLFSVADARLPRPCQQVPFRFAISGNGGQSCNSQAFSGCASPC